MQTRKIQDFPMITLTNKDKALLEHFAHYVWWEKRDDIIANNPLRIVASAMKDANQTINTLSFKTTNNVKLSFFGNIEFIKHSSKIYSDDGILRFADLKSLLITKLKATCDRAEYKDYKDIVEILKTKKVTLEEGLCGFRQYFGNDFPIVQILKGLTCYEDGDLHKLSKDDKEILLNATKNIDISKIDSIKSKTQRHK